MNTLPLEVTLNIYDFMLGDVVHWKSVFNKVIIYLDRYNEDINYDMALHGTTDDYETIFRFNILRYHL